MSKTMTEIQFRLSKVTGIHPENIEVQLDGSSICAILEVARGTNTKPVLDAAFDYLSQIKFSKRMVELSVEVKTK